MSNHVVIIGAGPVGLIAAYQWILKHRKVTIYDSRSPSQATRPQIVLVGKENWSLVPSVVQERLKVNGVCVIADNTRVVCENDPDTNRQRGERGGRRKTTSGKDPHSWKGGISVSLNALQMEMYDYLLRQYPHHFRFVQQAFTNWKDIDSVTPLPEFILIADGGGRESIIHSIPELGNRTFQPLGYGGAITFDVSSSHVQQDLRAPNVQEWIKSQQIALILRTLSNHMYIALQISDATGQLLSGITDPRAKWDTFQKQVEGQIYAQLVERLPVLNQFISLPQLSIFPIRLRSLLQFTTVTPLLRIPVFVIGDAAFNVHFFTARGLNNGLREIHYLVSFDRTPPPGSSYNNFVIQLRHDTWVDATPNIYVDLDSLVKNCQRQHPNTDLADCVVETARVSPNEERKTSARMNAYVNQLSHRTFSSQISSPPIYQQNLFQSMTSSVTEKKDQIYKYLANEWIKKQSGQVSLFNSPNGYKSVPSVDPENKYEYKAFLDLSQALSDDGIILSIEADGKLRQISIDANKLNDIVPTVLTKLGYIGSPVQPLSPGRVRFGPAMPPPSPGLHPIHPGTLSRAIMSSTSPTFIPFSGAVGWQTKYDKRGGDRFLYKIGGEGAGRIHKVGGVWQADKWLGLNDKGEHRTFENFSEAKKWIEARNPSMVPTNLVVVPAPPVISKPSIPSLFTNNNNPVNRILQPAVPVEANSVLPDVIPPLPEKKGPIPRYTDDGYDFLLGTDLLSTPITGREFTLDLRTLDLIHFWAHQMEEHAHIIFLKVDDPDFKGHAYNLWQRWQSFYVTVFQPTRIEPDKIVLNQNDWKNYQRMAQLTPQDVVTRVMNGIQLLGLLKKEILQKATNGVWVGDLTPMYLSHLLRELQFFRRDLIEGWNIPAKDRIQFWDITSGEHAAMASRELDPKLRNRADKKKGDNFYKDFLTQVQRNADSKTTVEEADDAAAKKIGELRQWTLQAEQGLKNHTLMGTLHPQLQVEHDRREADRALYELDQLKKRAASPLTNAAAAAIGGGAVISSAEPDPVWMQRLGGRAAYDKYLNSVAQERRDVYQALRNEGLNPIDLNNPDEVAAAVANAAAGALSPAPLRRRTGSVGAVDLPE